MTPLGHLLQGPSNQKLQSLLQFHLDEQRKQKARLALEDSKGKLEELELELSKIVGLHELKLQLRTWAKGMLLDEKRRVLGLKIAPRRPPHMAFLGNPGTGITLTTLWKIALYFCLISFFSLHTFLHTCKRAWIFAAEKLSNIFKLQSTSDLVCCLQNHMYQTTRIRSSRKV